MYTFSILLCRRRRCFKGNIQQANRLSKDRKKRTYHDNRLQLLYYPSHIKIMFRKVLGREWGCKGIQEREEGKRWSEDLSVNISRKVSPLSWMKKQTAGNRHFYLDRLLVERSDMALIIQASLCPFFCNFSVVCIFLVYKRTWQLTIGNLDYPALISWVNHAWTK